MATYAVTDSQLTAIGDAIRLKRDTAEEFSVDDMPLAISLIEGGGGVQPAGLTYTDIVVDVECPSIKEWMALLFDSIIATGAPKNTFWYIEIVEDANTYASSDYRFVGAFAFLSPTNNQQIVVNAMYYRNGDYGIWSNISYYIGFTTIRNAKIKAGAKVRLWTITK